MSTTPSGIRTTLPIHPSPFACQVSANMAANAARWALYPVAALTRQGAVVCHVLFEPLQPDSPMLASGES